LFIRTLGRLSGLLHGRMVLTLLHVLVTHHLLTHACSEVTALASRTLMSEVALGVLGTGMDCVLAFLVHLLLHVLLLLK